MGVHGGYKKLPNDLLFGNRYMKKKAKLLEKKNEKIANEFDDFKTLSGRKKFFAPKSNKASFDKWVEFSTKQQDESTIRNKLIENQDSICLTFLCHYQKFSESFIEELYWITNRVFTKETFSIELIQMVIKFTNDFNTKEKRIKAAKRIKRYINNNPINLSDIELEYIPLGHYTTKTGTNLLDAMISVFNRSKDRLDWGELSNWNFSDQFREKYKAEFESAKSIFNNYDGFDNYSIPSPTLY